MNMRRKWVITALGAFCVGTVMGWLIGSARIRLPIVVSSGQVRANLPQYKFINPLLFSDNAKSSEQALTTLRSRLQSYVSDAKQKGLVNNMSIYFRDINSARWTGVNEDDLYTPSSMLKVVAMMAALKIAENNPGFLHKKLPYHKTVEGGQGYFPANDNAVEGEYSVEDLIGYTIRYSDNDAFNALVKDPQINAGFVQIYSLFRLSPVALEGSTTDFMSPKSFASIFRTLYNSSFFGWDLSDQVLTLLSQTTFTKGLVSGVPSGTVVSHKFGENTNQLHDCGIVYYPGRPYLLCVMTRGNDAQDLASAIGGVSREVWAFVGEGNLK